MESAPVHHSYAPVASAAGTKEDARSPLVTKADLAFLALLFALAIFTVARMAMRDMSGPQTNLCSHEADKLSKHLHCVSEDGTKSFASFLAHQGAKKGHPYYEAEKARIHSHAPKVHTHTKAPTVAQPRARSAERPPALVDDGGEDSLDPAVR